MHRGRPRSSRLVIYFQQYCCQTLGLVLRLRVDFDLPLSQEEQEEQEEEQEEEPTPKSILRGVLEG